MSETKDKLVDDSVCTDCPADEFERSIVGIIEDEVVEIEVAETSSSNASSQL
jgi:hypothetical protein